ncbi:hypothetical protein [Streptomyces sp. NPDC020965]|uniref:hypothetical protein n=1 Tax=Streptomyces sp. NPDC020965 TaxID=3365105 RepID=UPI0037AB9E16
MGGALAGALAATGVMLAPVTSAAADVTTKAPDAPRTERAPAPASGTQLATGERLELLGGDGKAGKGTGKKGPGFRVVPKEGSVPERYAYTHIDGQLKITPAGRSKPLPATTVTTRAPERPRAAARAATPTYSVTLQLTNSEHWGRGFSVWNRKTWVYHTVSQDDFGNKGKVKLPPGDYLALGMFSNWDQPSHMLTASFTVKNTNQTVNLDAAKAKETGLTTDEPTARRYTASVWLRLPNGNVAGFQGGWGEKVHVTPITLPGLSLRVHDVLVKEGSTPNRPSPYRYDLYHSFDNTVPTSPRVKVRTADLAKRAVTLRSQGRDSHGLLWSWRDVGDEAGASAHSPVRFPSAVTEYLTPGTTVSHGVGYADGHHLSAEARVPVKGANPAESFGIAPLAGRPCDGISIRNRHLQVFETCAYSDGSGKIGRDAPEAANAREATQDLTLSQGGTEIGRLRNGPLGTSWRTAIQRMDVPHTLVQTIRHNGRPSRFTPTQTTEWDFHPMRFLPELGINALTDVALRVDGLDDRNASGTDPVTVTAVATSRSASESAAVTGLEFSADSGATWTELPFQGSGATVTAQLTVPDKARFISLRATAGGSDSSNVRRTIIRAFAGPAPLGDETVGATRISDVVVNGGRVIAPHMEEDFGSPPFNVRYTVSDPAGVASSGVTLYRGPAARPEALLHTWTPTCVKKKATSYDCVAEFRLNARAQLGRNEFSGEWQVAAWASSADGESFTDRSGLGTGQILRQSRMTITGPATRVTRGTAFTISGIAGIADWSTGRWNALPAKSVNLEFRKSGTTAWIKAATVKSSATGTVKSTQKATSDGNWRWLLPRTPGVGAAVSPLRFVDVR